MRQPKRDGQAHSDESGIDGRGSNADQAKNAMTIGFWATYGIFATVDDYFWHGGQRHALAHIAIAMRRRPRNLLHMIIRFTQFGRDLGLSCPHGDTGGWATIVGPCLVLGRRQTLSINS
jgi:hypothetical protein